MRWGSLMVSGLQPCRHVISKEHPVSGGGGVVSGSRFNVRDGTLTLTLFDEAQPFLTRQQYFKK